jgi:hypothetical protein
VQKEISAILASKKQQALIKRITHAPDLAIFQGHCSPFSKAFWSPTNYFAASLSNLEISQALAHRILYKTHSTVKSCNLCKQTILPIDQQHHPMTCSHENGLRVHRHDEVKKAMATALEHLAASVARESPTSAQNFTVTKESLLRARYTPKATSTSANAVSMHRSDITLTFNQGSVSQVYELDLVIAHPLLKNKVGDAAAKHYDNKNKKYLDNWEIRPSDFIPVAFESSGYLHPASLAFLTQLFHRCVPNLDDKHTNPLYIKHLLNFRARISSALVAGNARIAIDHKNAMLLSLNS